MVYTFKELSTGKIDIFEDGKSIAQGGPGYTPEYASSLGYRKMASPDPVPPTPEAPKNNLLSDGKIVATDNTGNVIGGSQPGAVTSSDSIRRVIAQSGIQKPEFKSELDFEKFKASVAPGNKPERPDLASQYRDLQTTYKVGDTEKEIATITEQKALLEQNLRKFRTKEYEGQALGFATGRIGEEESNVLERMDFLTRRENAATNRLNSANKTIETVMNLTDKDYANARSDYEYDFAKNMQLLSSFQTATNEEESEQQEMQNTAKANLQIIYNALADGSVSFDSLSPAQMTDIVRMELDAGLPSGFFATIQTAIPDSKILSTTTRETGGSKYADIVYQNSDGSVSVGNVLLSGPGSTSTTTPSGSGSSSSSKTGSFPSWEEYLKAASAELRMNIDPSSTLGKQLRAQYDEEAKKTKTTTAPVKKSSSSGRTI